MARGQVAAKRLHPHLLLRPWVLQCPQFANPLHQSSYAPLSCFCCPGGGAQGCSDLLQACIA